MGTVQAWLNEYEGWKALGRTPEASGRFETEQIGPLTCAWWQQDPAEMENYLLLDPHFTGDLAAVLADVAPKVAASPAGTVLRFAATERSSLWRTVAARFGYWDAGSAPLMVCPLSESRPVPRTEPGVTAHRARGADYDAALNVAQAVFGGTAALTRFFNPPAPITVYAGYWRGEPVATAALWPFAGVAGVFSVATLPAYRGRGLASAVINAVLIDGAAAGFSMASLRTTDELIPFYERLGFRSAGRVQTCVKPL